MRPPPPPSDGQENDGGAIRNYYLHYFAGVNPAKVACVYFILFFFLLSRFVRTCIFPLLEPVTPDAFCGSFFYESVQNGTNELAANCLASPSLCGS